MLTHNPYPAHFLVLVHRLHLILIHFIVPGWYRIMPDLHVVLDFMVAAG